MRKPSNAFERHLAILKITRERQSVRVPELAELLEVSEVTIRNDLEILHEQKELIRVRGGAVAKDVLLNAKDRIQEKASQNADQKIWLAQWAAGLIENGDILLFDASTTVLYIASFLADRHNLTVITNGLEVARLIAKDPSNRVMIVGGLLRSDGNAITGTFNGLSFEDYHVNKAFVSCWGFIPEQGFFEVDIQEAQMKSQMMKLARRRIMLVDSSKIGKVGLTTFASLDDVDYLVTDSDTPKETINKIRKNQINVVVCDEKTVSTYSAYDDQKTYYRIGFANLSEKTPFSRDVRRGLERAAHDSEKIELILADNQLDSQVALQVADELLKQAPDLVIEYQIDESIGNLIAHRFKRANIPVIAVDIPMVGATFFGVDNYGAGQMAGVQLGNAIQQEWRGKFDYLIVVEQQRAGYLPAMRIQGQINGVEEVVGTIPEDRIVCLDTDNTMEGNYTAMLNLSKKLGSGHKLAIVCFNDDASIGVLQAARQVGEEKNILLVGQGADRRLREEMRQENTRVVGATAYRPEAYGKQLVELAIKILKGEQVPPAIYMHHVFISPDNVNHYYPPELEDHLHYT
jgi:ribose transport system substrate-binding protein